MWAEPPQEVGRRLADLRELAEFSLLPRAIETIEDTYFDTLDGSLQAQLIALRVRRLDGTPLLTKADSRSAVAGADRLEIESSWSPTALHDVLSELRNRGVGVPDSPAN